MSVSGKFRERNFRRGGTEIDFLLLRREWEVRKGDSRSLLPAPSFDEKALNGTERSQCKQRERRGSLVLRRWRDDLPEGSAMVSSLLSS